MDKDKDYDYKDMAENDYECQCEFAGYCPLLEEVMTPHLHKLCKTSADHRKSFLKNAMQRGVHNEKVKRAFSNQQIETMKSAEEADRVVKEIKQQGHKLDDNPSEGLGDTIEKVLKKFGITQEKIENVIGSKGCGCSERKKWFNKIFSYKENKDQEDEE